MAPDLARPARSCPCPASASSTQVRSNGALLGGRARRRARLPGPRRGNFAFRAIWEIFFAKQAVSFAINRQMVACRYVATTCLRYRIGRSVKHPQWLAPIGGLFDDRNFRAPRRLGNMNRKMHKWQTASTSGPQTRLANLASGIPLIAKREICPRLVDGGIR